jgi:hypothetical protein
MMVCRSDIRGRVTVAGAMAALLLASTVASVSADPLNFGCGRGQEKVTVEFVRHTYLEAGSLVDPLEAWLATVNTNGDDYLCLVPAQNPDASWWPDGFLNVVDNHAAVGD